MPSSQRARYPEPARAARAGLLLLAALSAGSRPLGAQGAVVGGSVVVTDRGDRPADDVAQAVVWLSGPGAPRAAPVRAEIATEGKQFLPRVLVVPAGSSVSFPNHDPFNHNVFSLSDEAPFDLGQYGRGEAKAVTFARPGIVRVYCNIHATMAAFVVVTPGALHAQPGGDGSFAIRGVPPGTWTLTAWHERAPLVTQPLAVRADTTLRLALDARGFAFQPHLNKFGRPYTTGGRRY
ncbi:MAG: carboxypeptidase regulatory-like domain-containing protein [Gemmatimonadales bacterium]|nr:carboxypeptidase regulatory-like domain-containing protein [Gemmatimonadales bacterium]